MANLQIPVNGEYFDAMQCGEKLEEYRLVTDYWTKRLLQRNYDRLIITRGYPPKGDLSRRLDMKYHGFTVKTITHKHFGPDPVMVYAIKIIRDKK